MQREMLISVTQFFRDPDAWAVKKQQLELAWVEKGGPELVGPPATEGFGSLLARRSISGQLDGELRYEWNPEGLIVRLSAPAERLTF